MAHLSEDREQLCGSLLSSSLVGHCGGKWAFAGNRMGGVLGPEISVLESENW